MSDEVKLTWSINIGNLAEAMAKAQEEMAPAAKDSTNPHFKNRYASLASCFEACKPMHKNKIAIFQPPAMHGPDGVCVKTLLVHASGEWLVGELYMPALKKDPQGFGSAITYARRYCLQSTVGLPADDDDAEAAKVKPEPVKAAPPAKSDIDADALVKALESAVDSKDPAKALSEASLAVGKVASKLSEADRQRCRAAHDETMRRIDAKEKAA